MDASTQEHHVEALVKQLQGDFAGHDPRAIERLVRQEFEAVEREARVPDFVPILTERRVRRSLRGGGAIRLREDT